MTTRYKRLNTLWLGMTFGVAEVLHALQDRHPIAPLPVEHDGSLPPQVDFAAVLESEGNTVLLTQVDCVDASEMLSLLLAQEDMYIDGSWFVVDSVVTELLATLDTVAPLEPVRLDAALTREIDFREEPSINLESSERSSAYAVSDGDWGWGSHNMHIVYWVVGGLVVVGGIVLAVTLSDSGSGGGSGGGGHPPSEAHNVLAETLSDSGGEGNDSSEAHTFLTVTSSGSGSGDGGAGGQIPQNSFWMIGGNNSPYDVDKLKGIDVKLDDFFSAGSVTFDTYVYAYLLKSNKYNPQSKSDIEALEALSRSMDKLDVRYYVDVSGSFVQECGNISAGVAEIITYLGQGENIIYEHEGSACLGGAEDQQDFIQSYWDQGGGTVAVTTGPSNAVGSLHTYGLNAALPEIYDTGNEGDGLWDGSNPVSPPNWNTSGNHYADKFSSVMDDTIFLFSAEQHVGAKQYGHFVGSNCAASDSLGACFLSGIDDFSTGAGNPSNLNMGVYMFTSDDGPDYGFYDAILGG